MTAVCPGGGASHPIAGRAEELILSAAVATAFCPPALVWLLPFLDASVAIMTLHLSTFCAIDPPADPGLTGSDIDAIMTARYTPAGAAGAAKVIQLIQRALWYAFCECVTTGPLPTPALPAPPVGTPSTSPQSVGGSPGSYLAAVMADAPLNYWRMAEAGGNIAQDIGSSPLALLCGTTVLTTPYGGPNSDGGSAYVDSNQGILNFLSVVRTWPITVEAWVWLHGPISAKQAVVSVIDGAGFSVAYLCIDTNGHIELDSPAGNVAGTTVITPQRWHHLVGTYDSTNAHAYLDGAIEATLLGANVAVNKNTEIAVGCKVVALAVSDQARANISEAALYGTALSAARVLAHFNAADNTALPPRYGGAGVNSLTSGNSQSIAQLLDNVQRLVGQVGTISPAAVTSYAEAAVHAGLTGTGLIALAGGCLAVKAIITADTTGHRVDTGTPSYYFDRGYIVPESVEGPVRQLQRLVYNPQVFQLPQLTTAVGYTLPPGVTISLTELVRGP